MNRIIKFRVWDKVDKEMLYWDKWYQEILDAIPYDAGDEWTERCEVMQFTGFLDKVGKEIYEGDIIVFNNTKYEIKNGIYCWGDYILNGDYLLNRKGIAMNFGFPLSNIHNSDIEIIGNIFENPKLCLTF